MSFSNMGILSFSLGALALAGALFLLQRLRVRHRDLRVPTTMFWREAVERARARSLVERFRHLLAYLLVLAIALTLWAALASPSSSADEGTTHLVLIDASAGMAESDRFERAVESALEVVARLPREATTVRLCGAVPQTVLLPDENPSLLARRLEGSATDTCPSTIELELLRMSRESSSRRHAVVIGGRPVDAAILARLPAGSQVERIACARSTPFRNAGITTLAVTEASSGSYDRCDVFVEARGTDLGPVDVVIGDADPVRIEPISCDVGAVYELADVQASGAWLRATLASGGALSLDDAAELRLPERRVFRVQLVGIVPPALRTALDADAAVEIVDDTPDLVVRVASAEDLGVPTLELSTMDESGHAILVRSPDAARGVGSNSERKLLELLPTLGLDSVDWMEVAGAAGRTVSIGSEVGERRSVSLWQELLTDQFDFTRSRAFPMFVAAAVRWLSGEPEWTSRLAAGEPSSWVSPVLDARGARQDPIGAAFVPPFSGRYADADTGREFAVALADPATTEPSGDEVPEEESTDLGPIDWSYWLALGALVLLCCEWVLYRNGRMP